MNLPRESRKEPASRANEFDWPIDVFPSAIAKPVSDWPVWAANSGAVLQHLRAVLAQRGSTGLPKHVLACLSRVLFQVSTLSILLLDGSITKPMRWVRRSRSWIAGRAGIRKWLGHT
jgi:hypothetical protein